ncbi:MAG: permease [bacterium]
MNDHCSRHSEAPLHEHSQSEKPAVHCHAEQKAVTSCCAPAAEASSCHDQGAKRDYLLIVSGTIVVLGYLLYFLVDGHSALPTWIIHMTGGIYELVNRMWWGLVAAVIFVGVLDRIPRDLVMATLGPGGSFKGIFRATLAGVMLDLCSHGILMVGVKLYERGASLGQLMAFLIASPWNSLSLTIILVALIGLKWTLVFIVLSMAVGIVTGLIFDALVARKTLPANPHHDGHQSSADLKQEFRKLMTSIRFTPAGFYQLFKDGLKGSQMVFRWLLFGIVLATLIRAVVPLDAYQAWFGPTLAGLALTLFFATIIEVCSEGSTPIAADLLTRAAAPGNGFAFLMAGISTDYTEIMVLRDTMKNWKVPLFLPLLTLPQILIISWLLNQVGV